ncbi:MAG: lysine--tRNA ligase, partial [Candidatus Aenigmarchaeota archaeon]|nr:lysine--tRNA ligase [Candidatus Aenigmarchaeota archaeon]
MHWADGFAKEVIEKKDKGEFIVESGITPSGVVHIGNARELMTQYFVYKSILKSGMKAKFIYIWDDFD